MTRPTPLSTAGSAEGISSKDLVKNIRQRARDLRIQRIEFASALLLDMAADEIERLRQPVAEDPLAIAMIISPELFEPQAMGSSVCERDRRDLCAKVDKILKLIGGGK